MRETGPEGIAIGAMIAIAGIMILSALVSTETQILPKGPARQEVQAVGNQAIAAFGLDQSVMIGAVIAVVSGLGSVAGAIILLGRRGQDNADAV